MKYLFTQILLLVFAIAQSQPINDDCFSAINLDDIDNFCSPNGGFTNFNASPDASFTNNCFLGFENAVWYSFRPTEPDILVQVFSGNQLGDLEDPRMALFTGLCSDLTLVECSPGRSRFTDEMLVSGLTPGQLYYLYIESATGFDGSFTLCVNDFIAQRSPESDCPQAVILCDKSSFQVAEVISSGDDPNELDGYPGFCLDGLEFFSAWYKWTCDQPGTLTFNIIPDNYIPGFESDDIDFAVFELPAGIDDCANKVPIRCMGSGANILNNVPAPFSEWEICNGPTGLLLGDPDLEEGGGCSSSDNNYAQAIQMQSGVSYALVVLNFTRSGLGFSLDFGGTGTFLGPEPDFEITTTTELICDQKILVTNNSQSLTDPIQSYSWNFGEGSFPPIATGEGPHEIEYSSIGEKSIILTIESTKGCIVSKILDIEIGSCCENVTDLDVATISTDVTCNGDTNGSISVEGIGGFPDYNYSLDGGPFSPNTLLNNLAAGDYEIIIQDSKGCEVSVIETISEPPPIVVDAGPDVTIDLGESTVLNGTYTPMQSGDIISWTPSEGLSCSDCLDPIVLSPGTTTFTLTITDEIGCTSSDEVTITTNIIRPLYYPNVITPTTNDVNSFFTLELGPQAALIEEFSVFDRWGHPIYKCDNIDPQDPLFGWDGRFGICNGQTDDFVDPGVFVWIAKVRFIDDVTIPYVDEVTVLK